MICINIRVMAVMTALFTLWALPATGSSFLELGKSGKPTSIVAIGKAPEKKVKPIALGPLRMTKGELPAGRLTLKQRMRKRLQQGRSRTETLTKANRDRLKRVRTGKREDPDDSSSERDEDEDEEDEEMGFRDLDDDGEGQRDGEDDELSLLNDDEDDDGDTEGLDAGDRLVAKNGEVPEDSDESDRAPRAQPEQRQVRDTAKGDVDLSGGTTAAGKSIELKFDAKDTNGDLNIGLEG